MSKNEMLHIFNTMYIVCLCVCVCLSVMLKKTFDNKFSCLNIVKTQNNFSYDV